MSNGKFIVLEGIDGCGKSTQIKLLSEALDNHDIRHHVTRECSDGPIGKLLRQTYLTGKRGCDERVINSLYAADRLDHITNSEDGMLNFINDECSVICDRYVMSSLAYDTYSSIGTDFFDLDMKSIIERNRVNMDLLTPDITIVLDVPVAVALERINDRSGKGSIYESSEKLAKISMAYSRAIDILRDKYHNRIEVIDGTKSIMDIHYMIWDLVAPLVIDSSK